jgi:hypothetical protein
VPTVFPPSAGRYGGSMAVSTSWAQHGATTGRSTGDVGAAASPARRRRRGARPQLLGGDAGSGGPRASSLPPALPLPLLLLHSPDFWWRRWIWIGGSSPRGRRRNRESWRIGWDLKGGAARVWSPGEWRMRLLGRVAGTAGSSAVGAAAMEGPTRAPLPPRDMSRGGR